MNTLRLIFIALVLAPGLCFAAAPELRISRSVIVHVSPQAVWQKIGDFGGINRWHPAVASARIVAGTDNVAGAERLLTFGDGGTIREKLLGFDAKHHRYRYEILEGVLPVSAYTSVLGVKAAGKGRSKVTWSGNFKRKNTAAHPAPGENDATAVKIIGSVYQGGLDNLKKLIEAK